MSEAKEMEQTDLEAMEGKVLSELDALCALSDDEKKVKLADVKEMITYYTQATSMIEDRRAKIHAVGLQLLGISIAACAIVASMQDKLWDSWLTKLIFIFALALSGILFAAAIIAALVYETQSRFRYPFLKLSNYGNRWKWFYYGNPSVLKMSSNVFRRQKTYDADAVPYLKGLGFFVERYRKEGLDAELTDDILHLYLLQVHNYYKNRWYLQLTQIWRWAFVAICLALVEFVLIVGAIGLLGVL